MKCFVVAVVLAFAFSSVSAAPLSFVYSPSVGLTRSFAPISFGAPGALYARSSYLADPIYASPPQLALAPQVAFPAPRFAVAPQVAFSAPQVALAQHVAFSAPQVAVAPKVAFAHVAPTVPVAPIAVAPKVAVAPIEPVAPVVPVASVGVVPEATYVASNPGVTHITTLPGHRSSVISENIELAPGTVPV